MENASKALIIAGSVLMAVLVIGALMLMYNQIADIEQTKTDNDELSKMEDYSKKFEEYNGTIYGSELFSLANLQDDYTKRYKKEDGYTKITITVIINNSISGTSYFQSGENDINDILNYKDDIEKEINGIEGKQTLGNKGKSVKYYTQLSIRQLVDSLKKNKLISDEYEPASDADENTIKEELIGLNNKCQQLFEDIEKYKNIKSVYTEFKNKRFKCTNVTYNKYNGRIESMNFEEK